MEQKPKKEIVNARKINMMRCIAGLAMCSVVIILTSVVLVLNIINFFSDVPKEAGVGTLKMFTTISNIAALVASFACLPYQIDGIRKDKYKLPNWIVVLMYVCASCVFLTFSMAITLISIVQGLYVAMVRNSNIFMHTINPLIITVVFLFIITDDHIKFRFSFLPLAPVLVYGVVYYVMVFALHIWEDHYYTNKFVPWPFAFLLVSVVAFGVAQLLRFVHNLNHKRVVKSIARYYKESKDYAFPRVSDAIAKLAEVEAKFYHNGDDIYIPVDIIQLLSERYSASIVPLDILYDIYLENYLKSIKRENA